MNNGDRLILATNNAHKVREIKAILGTHFASIVAMSEAGLDLDPEETGTTFNENAILKARAVAQAANCWALADDSGICVDALGGAPGVYSARYGGPKKDDHANNMKLLAELQGKPSRAAHYACAVALVGGDGTIVTAEGRCDGQVTDSPRGNRGFGYDPYFIPDGYGCTMAELTDEEKNTISHRRRALEALLAKLEHSMI